ncbi:DUF1206 domain-containing protein [Demequina sp. NBRC 110056]|uniref:DUF1206 domain-containing protein n=1 Tax=Demequina sp. NBRC 110056 TaxID=1570345 RepID=UPI000A064F0B|nr:DUF1206 domain-containing protein [Demequina sp. NBRC 110056]
MVTSSTPLTPTTGRDGWEKAARAGYAVSGALHVLLGFLIARIGFGGEAEADQSAALSGVADAPGGVILLWIAVAAFVALGTWQIAEVFRPGGDAKDRVKDGGKAGVYLALAVTAASIALSGGDSGSGDSSAQGFAGALMSAPAGRILVGAVALGILVTGGFHIYKGATRKFREDLTRSGTATTWLGTVGYIAKGVALVVVGVLFAYAAITADPEEAKGLDGAVESLLGAPGGPVLVVLVGVGFAAYGLYSFARARYARMR